MEGGGARGDEFLEDCDSDDVTSVSFAAEANGAIWEGSWEMRREGKGCVQET